MIGSPQALATLKPLWLDKKAEAGENENACVQVNHTQTKKNKKIFKNFPFFFNSVLPNLANYCLVDIIVDVVFVRFATNIREKCTP